MIDSFHKKMLHFRTLCACLVCFVVVVFTYAQEAPKSQQDKIAVHFYNKCYYSTKSLIPFQKLYNDTTDFMTQMNVAAQFIPDRMSYFCDIEKKHLSTKAERIANDLTPCLHPEEKYLSGFVEDAVKEGLNFLCKKNGENAQRLFSGQTSNCIRTLENDNLQEIDKCFGKIFKPLSKDYVTKKEFCDDMDVARKCLTVVLEQKCPGTKSIQELNEGFFQSIGKTCSSCVSFYLSTSLLIVSVVLPFLFNY